MDKPYVVSADIMSLLSRWAEQKGFVLPAPEFVSQLQNEFCAFLRGIFPSFEFVPEAELINGITQLVSRSGVAPISLDRVYFCAEAHHLDISRLVDIEGGDRGLGHRPGTPPLLQQFTELKRARLEEVVLVDDVIFSGVLIERIIRHLSRLGVRVPLVCAGIGIDEGIDRINQSKCEVRCVRRYRAVADEVCERDFYPGVPFSGRLLIGDGNLGVPYLLPFGDPGKWASIPSAHQTAFSRFCIRQTTRLFVEIERRSNRIVRCSDTGRMVATLPGDDTRFVDALRGL